MIGDTVGPRARRPRRRAERHARGGAGDLPRPRPRDLPLRHLVEPDGRGRLHRERASGPATSTGSSGSPRPTSPGSAPARSRPRSRATSPSCSSSAATSTARTRDDAVARAGSTLVMLRQAVRLNSLSEVALTKLDVLDGLSRRQGLRRLRGRRRAAHPRALPPVGASTRCVPIYEELPGWRDRPLWGDAGAGPARRGP